ncbi:MAG: hypothetical protein LBV17_02850 [Treponema sp.]|jgi:hypothetical protein|nr:hypothetical protein [Treponema sp.]
MGKFIQIKYSKIIKFWHILNGLVLLSLMTLFIGCNSVPKNVTKEGYNKVRDYVSIEVSGMPYLKLYGLLVVVGNDYEKYNDYMIEISNKMNQLVYYYNQTDLVEEFYSWVVNNYSKLILF